MKLPFNESQLKAFWDFVDKEYFDGDEWIKPYGTCTFVNSAQFTFLKEHGFSVKMYGADEKICENTDLTKKFGMITGHDWALINNRWIIDIWVYAYLSVKQLIYDLEDIKDKKIVNSLYPPKNQWNLMYSPTVKAKYDKEHEAWHKDADEDWKNFLKINCI